MTRVARVLTERLLERGVPLIREEFGVESCIASTRIALEVFAHFGIAADAVPVNVALFNAQYRAGVLAGTLDDDDRSTWPEGAWSIGIGMRGANDATGHLVTLAEGDLIVDLTLDQASRPQHGLHVTPAAFALAEAPAAAFSRGETVEFERSDGAVIMYQRAKETDRWWTVSRNWGREHAAIRRRIVGRIIRAIRGNA